MRGRARSSRSSSKSGGPPAWLVFLVGAALVFGLYYLWQGVQNFFATGGQGVTEATERAVVVSTATAARETRLELAGEITPRPSNTPVPECQDFEVSVPNAIIRDGPSAGAAIIGSLNEGEVVCVLEHFPESQWYVIDQTPGTRRLDLAYMHETVIRAVRPTPRPSITPTPLPTVTPLPTATRTQTPVPSPTSRATPTEETSPTVPAQAPPTATPSPTLFRQSA